MELSATTSENRLGILHLNRFYDKVMAKRNGTLQSDALQEEWKLDTTMLFTLNLGLEQTIRHIFNTAPSLEGFEDWILQLNNHELPQEKIKRFNASITGDPIAASIPASDIALPLDANDLRQWDEQGFVIVRNAISPEDCKATVDAICAFMQIDIADPATWYKHDPAKQGIMVQFFQHEILEKNRHSPKIKAAFEQIWQRNDLWVTADRVSFNPPENEHWHFPGPKLHWDVSLDLPIPFGTQGLLYLSDTLSNQGAFTLVPGFQHKIEDWINSLPAGTNPRTEDLYALGAKPVAANAGDFILWNQALPHGSSPNTARLPRIVQYINYEPMDAEKKAVWL
jgi:hypothetical protein